MSPNQGRIRLVFSSVTKRPLRSYSPNSLGSGPTSPACPKEWTTSPASDKWTRLQSLRPGKAVALERIMDHLLAWIDGARAPAGGGKTMARRTLKTNTTAIATKDAGSSGLFWGRAQLLTNPRPPAAPATLNLSLEQYYAACAAVGLLSAQTSEPDQDSAVRWSVEFGEKLANATRQKSWGQK